MAGNMVKVIPPVILSNIKIAIIDIFINEFLNLYICYIVSIIILFIFIYIYKYINLNQIINVNYCSEQIRNHC